jgi:hypothetical protein
MKKIIFIIICLFADNSVINKTNNTYERRRLETPNKGKYLWQ